MRGLVFNAVTDTDGLGTISPSRLATTWQWVAKSQQIALDKLNPESVVNRQILHSVNAAK
jgi:NitT/TauT family transport system substrate-binding protein